MSSFVQAKGPQFDPIAIPVEAETLDHAQLKGVRFPNEGGQRVLLIHGFSENTNVFNDFALNLYKQGYDVFAFNFRGHGNDEQRSLVRGQKASQETKTGAYGFDRVITQDIPTMIDFVYDGKPIMVIGHSLGGAASRLFLSGVRDYGDGVHLTKDSRKLNKYLNKVKSLTAIGSPTSFQKADFRFKLWTKLPDSLTNLMLQPAMRKYLGEYIFASLTNLDNIKNPKDPKATERLFTEAFSLIGSDLISDVQRWSENVFSSRTGVQYEGLSVPQGLKFYQIAGGEDKLVPLDEILREHSEFKITSTPELLLFKNFSHIDLVAGRKSARMLGQLVPYIEAGKSFNAVKSGNEIKPIQINTRSQRSCAKLFSL